MEHLLFSPNPSSLLSRSPNADREELRDGGNQEKLVTSPLTHTAKLKYFYAR